MKSKLVADPTEEEFKLSDSSFAIIIYPDNSNEIYTTKPGICHYSVYQEALIHSQKLYQLKKINSI